MGAEMPELDSFIFAAFRMTIEATDPLYLPDYKGSAIRGSFGHAFRRAVCPLTAKECQDCDLSPKCVYSYVFETPTPRDDPFFRNRDKAPHPYIIRSPSDNREKYKPGEEMASDLILIGKATDYLPYFAYAFVYMGQRGLGRGRGKFMLKQIDSLGPDGSQVPVYLNTDQALRNKTIHITCGQLMENSPVPEKLTLRFLTRLEIKIKRKYPEINFGVLFRSLLRRVTTLAHLHSWINCSDTDFKGLSHAAEEIRTISSSLEWEDASRYSNRQKRRMPFGGLRGEITFEGNFEPFWPFILLGEWIHVGKKTTFGLGQYELVKHE